MPVQDSPTVCRLQPECDASPNRGGFIGRKALQGDPTVKARPSGVIHHNTAAFGDFEAPAHSDDVVVGDFPRCQHLLPDLGSIGHRQVEHLEDDLILPVMIPT